MPAETAILSRECPYCQYDMSGTTLAWEGRGIDSGRCPECGEVLLLEEFATLERRPPPWLFEADVRHPLVSFLLTCAHLAVPWRFWKLVRLEHRPDGWRLLTFATFCGMIATGSAGALLSEYAWAPEAHPGAYLGWCIGLWFLPACSIRLLSPYSSESRLSVRQSPLRPASYSVIIPAVVMPVAFGVAAAAHASGNPADGGKIAVAGLLASIAVAAVYWWFVVRFYLRVTSPGRFFVWVGMFTVALVLAWTAVYGIAVAIIAFVIERG